VYLSLICIDLRQYGTSANLKDSCKRYKSNLTLLLRKMQDKRPVEGRVVQPVCMLLPSSTFKQVWNAFVVVLLIYTATVMPYHMAFVETQSTGQWFIIDAVIDVSFFLDIIVVFFSAYEEDDGSIVTDRRRIAWNYLTTWLIIDCIAVFPFELLESGSSEVSVSSSGGYKHLLRLMKLPRLYRLIRIVRLLKFASKNKASDFMERLQDLLQLNTGFVRTSTFVVTLLTVVHIAGCLWFMLAKLEGFHPDSWVTRSDLLDRSRDEQYIASIYWAFTTLCTVGYGDITPLTEAERLFGIFWMMVGASFNSFTIGSLTSILSVLNSSNNDLNMKLNAVEQLAREAKLKRSLTRKLREAVKLNAKKTQLGTVDKKEMYDALPKKLRYLLAKNMYESAAGRIPFFKGRSPEFIASVIPHLKFSYLEAEKSIYREGDDSDEIYFLYRGRVDFVNSVRVIPFKTMLEGSYFGDIEVIDRTKRICSSRSQTDCELLVLELSVRTTQRFKELKEDFPEVWEEMKELASIRRDKLLQDQRDVVEALNRTVRKCRSSMKMLRKAEQALNVSRTDSLSV
jgi:hyperpolarization activated cyclic nucleotide-gated potassium channel 1